MDSDSRGDDETGDERELGLGVDVFVVRGMKLYQRADELIETQGPDRHAALAKARGLVVRAATLFDGRAPAYWAAAQSTLSFVHKRLAWAEPEHARAHYERAIEYRLNALRAWAPGTDLEYLADDHYHLALLYDARIAGSPPDNRALAIEHARAAVDGYPRDTMPVYWSNAQHVLGDVLLGTPDAYATQDTDEAIACFDRALEVRSPGRDVAAWARTHERRGVAFDVRRAGSRADNVEEALASFDAALGRLGVDDDPSLWAELHDSASITLASREAGDQAENAERTIGHLHQCLVVITQESHPDRWASVHYALGAAYDKRVAGDRQANLEAAISHCRQALDVHTEDTHPELWARTQRGLGIAYVGLEKVSHRSEDREHAERHLENSLRVRSRESHPHEWAVTVEVLAAVRCSRGTASTEDLTEGLRLMDEAAEVHSATRDHRALHSNRIARLGLVQQLARRSKPAESLADLPARPDELDELRSLLADAPVDERPGQHRALAAYLGDLLGRFGRWEEAADAYLSAVAADERLVSASVTRAGREAAAGRPVTRDAAYALARVGRPVEAVVVLERGRARALGDRLGDDLTGAGPSVSRLAEIDPDLAERYRSARERLRAAQDADLSGSIGRRSRREVRAGDVKRPVQDDDRHFADIARRTRDAAAEEADMLRRIRQLPGFAEFRRRADFETIRGAAEPGCPLVYLATTDRGSVMLIVTRSPDGDCRVDTVWSDFTDADAYSILMHSSQDDSRFRVMNGYAMRLEGLVETVFADGSSALTRGAAFGQGVRQRTGRDEDGGMWRLGERVVAPLARALELRGATEVALVISGRLGEFPVHTAPFHSGTDAPRLIDTVDVALVPSARVLRHARDRARAAWASPSLGGLANPMPHDTPLAFATQEVQRIASLFPQAAVRVDTAATRDAALHEFHSATHVHLACHGSYLGDYCPHLEFENGTEVTLSDIIREQPFAGARLVTLSACQTAIPSARFGENDEVDGLPSALLGAGTPAVIATLWPVDDLSTTLLMERFYAFHLFGDPGAGEGPLPPHRALCRAQRWLARVTAGELAKFFARQPSLGRDVEDLPSGPRYPAATAVRNALRFGSRDPEERPFAEDWFWGAFILVGA